MMMKSTTRILQKVALLCSVLLSLCQIGFVSASDNERKISIFNQSGTKVEIYWIHPQTGEQVLQSDPFIYNGATFNLNSFVSHAFEAREMMNKKTGKCGGKDDTCRVGYFEVNENEDQAVFINEKFHIRFQDNKSLARESASELINICKAEVIDELEDGKMTAEEAVESLKECVETGVAIEMEKANEEIAFQKKIRHDMAEHWENYTCADYDLVTSEPLEETRWYYKGKYVYDVNIMLNRPSSKVHVIKDFITEEECKAMEDTARPKLHKATVADGKGGSELSPNRMALQAGIKIPWNLEKDGNPLTTLSRRVYDYTNHVLGMDIKEHGQEDLMSIQYKGRGEDEETPDRYMPHCDGDCDGRDFKPGNRMATMVIYCTVPEVGGATNFRNSGIHVVPEKGTATFFSYINPETMKMDNGLTEHSGCPVVKGEKKIVTQWVRYGVDKENPWNSFNTLGIKISDEDD